MGPLPDNSADNNLAASVDTKSTTEQAPSAIAKIVLQTSLVVTNLGNNQLRLYYQLESGAVLESRYIPGSGWAQGTHVCNAIFQSPLAVTHWGTGSSTQIRLFYLDSKQVLNDYNYSEASNWTPGNLGQKGIVVRRDISLGAAHLPESGSGSLKLYVYYQAPDSDAITELSGTPTEWGSIQDITQGLKGSNIDAVGFQQQDLRVYYQSSNDVVQEYAFTGSQWTSGHEFAKAPERTSISVAHWSEGRVDLWVFWIDNQAYINYSRNLDDWTPPKHAGRAFNPTALASACWRNEKGQFVVSVFYQINTAAIKEVRYEGGEWKEYPVVG